jgi:terminase small subunit / prophage DNA-packing protein
MLYQIQQNEENGIYYPFDDIGQATAQDLDAEEVGQLLTACRVFFGADTLVACPGPGLETTPLQEICDDLISFTPTARRRRGRPTAASEKKRLKIKGTRKQIRRALLVSELADSGNHLAVFAELAREKGAGEVVPLALGGAPGPARTVGAIYLGGQNGHTDLAGLAQHLGLGRRRVQQLVKSEILPAPKKQRFDKDQATRAYIRFLRDHGSLSLKTYTEEKTRLTKEQADEKALKNAIQRGRLLPVDQVREVWAGHIINAKTKFLALPAKLSPEILSMEQISEVQAYLRRHINEVLDDLAASQVEGQTDGEV